MYVKYKQQLNGARASVLYVFIKLNIHVTNVKEVQFAYTFLFCVHFAHSHTNYWIICNYTLNFTFVKQLLFTQ